MAKRADTVTWPNPQASVTAAVRRADQPRARESATNGTQWSGAAVWRLPIAAAARASVGK
jgi:anti-sigma-K factor RskA